MASVAQVRNMSHRPLDLNLGVHKTHILNITMMIMCEKNNYFF